MGRRRTRIDPDSPLPAGLYRHGRKYRAYRERGQWTYFGEDYAEAMRLYASWKGGDASQDGTVAGLLNHFTSVVCPAKVKSKQLSTRTARDYLRDADVIKTGIGHIPYTQLRPHHVSKFRDARTQAAPSHTRNEIAALSATFAWAVEQGKVHANPCSEIEWPSKNVRTRLVTDDEFLTVYNRAGMAVMLAMQLCIRTLALPGDMLKMGPSNIIKLDDGRRVFRFSRGKTGVTVEIEIVGELAKLIDAHLAAKVVFPTFVHRRDGKPFTVGGIGAMFRRYAVGTKDRPRTNPVRDFGLRDLRAKGATDEYRNGRPIRELQMLLGHKSSKTTEIYLKSLVPETVRPNERPIIASV